LIRCNVFALTRLIFRDSIIFTIRYSLVIKLKSVLFFQSALLYMLTKHILRPFLPVIFVLASKHVGNLVYIHDDCYRAMTFSVCYCISTDYLSTREAYVILNNFP